VDELATLGLLADILVHLQSNLTGVVSRDADTYPTDEGGR